MGGATAGLLQNLGTGRLIVRFPVRRVVVLVGIIVAAVIRFVHFPALANRAIRTFGRIGQHDLGAVRLQDSLPLHGRIGWQAKNYPVPLHSRDHGIRNSGVSARGIENNPVVCQFAGALAVQNHLERCTVFNAATGIEVFGFGVDLDSRKVSRQSRQAQKRRVSDARENVRFLDRSYNGSRLRHVSESKGITFRYSISP